jgi:hypothetical protein
MTQHTYGKLKLMSLTIKRSSKGTDYLQGYLGNLSVIAFRGKPNQWGETWDIFLQEKQPQQGQKPRSDYRQRPSQEAIELFQRALDHQPQPPDDRLPWDE